MALGAYMAGGSSGSIMRKKKKSSTKPCIIPALSIMARMAKRGNGSRMANGGKDGGVSACRI